MKTLLFGAMALAPFIVAFQNVKPQVNVTVSEGTSMSVSVSPDGQTLAIDLQGSISTWPTKV